MRKFRVFSIIVACILLMLPAPHAGAQSAAQQPRINRFGHEGFRLMFQHRGLSPKTDQLDRWLATHQTVVVVLGDLKPLPRLWQPILSLFRNGGAVIIASDQGSGHELSRRLGVTFHAAPITVTGSPGYLGHADCPVVSDLQTQHPLFRGVPSLICNRAGYLQVRSESYSRIALPPEGAVDANGSRVTGLAAIACSKANPKGGRILLIADHSLFINEMLMHGSNGLFAWNTVNWLCAGTERKYLIFVQDGYLLPPVRLLHDQLPPVSLADQLAALSKADIPLRTPTPSTKTMLEFLNSLLTGLEDRGVWNAALAARPRNASVIIVRRWAIFIISGVVLFISLRWIMLSPSRPRRNLANETYPSTQLNLTKSRAGLEQCQQALALEFFQQDESFAFSQPLAKGPRAFVSGPILRRWHVRRQIGKLWQLARGRHGQRIRRRHLDRHIQRIMRLQALRDAGQLRLQWR